MFKSVRGKTKAPAAIWLDRVAALRLRQAMVSLPDGPGMGTKGGKGRLKRAADAIGMPYDVAYRLLRRDNARLDAETEAALQPRVARALKILASIEA